MRRASVVCTCTECGEEFTMSNSWDMANRRKMDSWMEWAKVHFNLCGKCYARRCREAEKQKGLYVDIRFSFGRRLGDSFPLAIIFKGDTMPHKDEIKALGADWTLDYPEDGRQFRWVLNCKPEESEETIKKVELLGARINRVPGESEIETYRQLKAVIKEELDGLEPEPDWPDEIKSKWLEGARWNGKFYGQEGRWCVYFGGVKTMLTDEEKASMEEAQEKRTEWLKKKEAIDKHAFRVGC